MIFVMFIFMILNFTYNFRDYGIKNIDNKAVVLAKTIEHSLTNQMLNDVIDKREIFLKQLEDLPNINKIWLTRQQKVIELYGNGLNNQTIKDEIDKRVLNTGISEKHLNESLFSNSTYRITIPYKATSTGAIDCMACHTNAKEGDTLGAISIIFPIDDVKQTGITTIINTTIIALVLIIAIGFLINYLISPFLMLFDSIKKVMGKAQNGDYSKRIEPSKNKEAQDVSLWINVLLEKLQTALDNIDSKISIFLSAEETKTKDPLINAENIIDRISAIYKFRKTIEHDEEIGDIYKRLAFIIKSNLNVENINILEANTKNGKLNYVYVDKKDFCDIKNVACRADKTNEIVDSSQFEDICTSCKVKDSNYLCIPYSISNDLDLIISIYPNNSSEIPALRENINFIKDYVEASKTVIISYKLMEILKENAITDPLTKLYNRKHLEDQMPKITAQANRASISFGILMLDIDHFKMVNDTYGHDIGDIAIKRIATTLKENTRNSDIIVRFGGEEFLVLLYNCKEENLIETSEKIRIEFSQQKIPAGDDIISKTISIGTSMFPQDNKDLLKCIKYSDTALYEAKNTGRNKTVRYTNILNKKETN
ncbi:MAG: GGDEF domain-containing protein [Arcobacter sp.]|nr:GGDEF domain-containing protein [Arcobacter sp.]